MVLDKILESLKLLQKGMSTQKGFQYLEKSYQKVLKGN